MFAERSPSHCHSQRRAVSHLTTIRNAAVVRKTPKNRTTRNVLIQTNRHIKLKWKGSKTFSGGKYNVVGKTKKKNIQTEQRKS